jgi:hypothetical protein
MAFDESALSAPLPFGMGTLRPEEVTGDDLPMALRGYDKERADRVGYREGEVGEAQVTRTV